VAFTLAEKAFTLTEISVLTLRNPKSRLHPAEKDDDFPFLPKVLVVRQD
jgi:hypothetical protein